MTFTHEDETLRIRSLGKDSGVFDSGIANVQKVILEHRGTRLWYQDAATYIHNDEPMSKAIRQLGFTDQEVSAP